MNPTFTEIERAILRIAQDNLPDSATPYADIARITGTDEAHVIHLLCRLRDEGAIRRFGASIKHQKTAWKHNAMVAWAIAPHLVDICGTYAAGLQNISHCYYRPSYTPEWPYTLYTMIHGRSMEECLDVVRQLQCETALEDYAVLESLKELKKISMTYF